ncbi:MAG TPA: DUF4126 domain-containing protein [Chitinophagales bacterium]|nr:DUF4126 domain-containing protein [Chitinophagales bacterium]HMY23459.1 DUF4126 domain-containing protein [Chitinophagales bacterium]HMZ33957.1 DUF4126 domain-containing protein [Chitinophagales bacterium]HNA39969.1 DUF4126 domain-containing protein [Chitinophagales bacterium]HNB49256.1 DUF4126 domain-containing protein [Chitinophagales bacterium]
MDTTIMQFVSKDALHFFSDNKVLLSLVMGLGLSASCGFRVFVPLLAASIATKMGILHLGEGFLWMGSTAALICFGAATIFEIGGYYIPFIDNILDTIMTPASVIAGTLLTASAILPDIDPMLKWGLGIIVGGGSAGIIQAGTALTRATSTATTAGVANPLVATIEHILAIVGSIFSIIIPFVIAAIVCIVIVVLLFFMIRYFKKHIPKTGMKTAIQK